MMTTGGGRRGPDEVEGKAVVFGSMILAAQSNSGGGAIGGMIGLIVAILVIAGGWKVYSKAGQPGWAVIVPIYNVIVLMRIAGKPWWWLFGLIVPFVNFVVLIMVMSGLAKAFGKGVGFTIGLILLSPIFYVILGFGSATYQGGYSTGRTAFAY